MWLSPSALGRPLALALLLALPASAATITVDSGTDDGVGCTLREAIVAADTDAPVGGCLAGDDLGDAIEFAVGSVTLTVGPVTVTEELDIVGPVVITAAPGSPILVVTGSETVDVADVTFLGGFGDGGGLRHAGTGLVRVFGGTFSGNRAPISGGGIWVGEAATLFVDGTMFSGNRADGTAAVDGGGGGLFSDGGAVTVVNATFVDNRALGADGAGGAILNPFGAPLLIENTTFDANRALGVGGAIATTGPAATIVKGGAMLDNRAGTAPGHGGALHVGDGGDVELSDGLTAVGNRAESGGGFWVGPMGTLTLKGVTVSGNIALGDALGQGGGGIFVDRGTLSVEVGTTLPSSIVGNRAVGTDGAGGGLYVDGGTVTIDDAAVAGNRAQRAGGGIEVVGAAGPAVVSLSGSDLSFNVVATNPGHGGGLHTSPGPVTVGLADSFVSANEAGARGGGIWIGAGTTLTLAGTDVALNLTRPGPGHGGGGIYNDGGTATIATATILGNATGGGDTVGGGILATGGSTTLRRSTVTENHARRGGGIAALPGAAVTVENTTVYGNAARFGGGVFSQEGTIAFDSATIAENVAEIGGGGLYNQNPPNMGVPFVTLTNSIVADNTASNKPNLAGRHASGGHNVIGTTPATPTFPAAPTDQVGTDPLLGPLDDNGGPTQTAALLAGSPAIDTGDTALDVDQRGEMRTDPDDVGAIEFFESGDPALALVLTGVVDGPLPGGLPKAAEIYVAQDVADLSLYAIGSANNGGGTDGPEFYLSGSATAGDYLHVASEAPGFSSFFGFAPDFTTGALGVNGDDAVELFYDADGAGGGGAASVIDTFGEIDATPGPWAYTDGWAYRIDNTGPGGSTFTLVDWTFSGVDALDGETSNATAATPFPIGTFSPVDTAHRTAAPTAALAETMAEAVRLGVAPNPLGGRATATFAVREAQPVTVALYDVVGRRVRALFSGDAPAEAEIEVAVEAGGLAAGVYVVVLQGATVRAVRQVTVVR